MRRSLGLISKRSRLLGKTSQNLTVPELVKTFELGSRVIISPRVRFSGMPHPRYRGRSGIISEKRGNAYVVAIKDGRMEKELIIPSVHLQSA
jgi:large subunit ribosomal protein L21e